MLAYWLVYMNVTNPKAYEEYKKRTPAALQKYGGKFLARGGRAQAVEGENPAGRVVLIEFPSFEQAMKCYNSPEYQEAKGFRAGAAEAQIVIVEGV
jgi:uncharacterized protein (DUF1330 family)